MSSQHRPFTAWLVAALPLVASCASIIGLEDAAGELEEDAAAAGPTSTGAGGTTSTATAGSTGTEAGSGGATTTTTTTTTTSTGGGEGGAGPGGGGGGGAGPVDFDVTLVEGVGTITDLQASLASAVFVAIDGIDEAGSLGDCAWAAPGGVHDRSALALRIDGDDTCHIVSRLDVVGAQLSVRSVGATFGGAFLGLGGTFQGQLDTGTGEPLLANGPVAFAALADAELPYVGFTNPELLGDGDGVGFVGGRGGQATFFGHFEGDATIRVVDAEFLGHCGETGTEGVTTIVAFPAHIDCPTAPPFPSGAGIVADVVSTSLQLGALYLTQNTAQLHLALMGSSPANDELLPLFSGVEAGARIAIEGNDTLIGGTLGPGVVPEAHCGVSLDVQTRSAFGAHVSAEPSCDGLWADARFRRAVPIGAVAGSSVYLVEGFPESPGLSGWWLASTDDLGIREVRRFCTDCSIVDATLAGTVAHVAGRTSVGDTVGGVTSELDGSFVARIARADLLTGLVPLEPR